MNDHRLEELFLSFRDRGDVRALGEVFDSAADELMSVARHLAADEAEAEDALQATFQTAIEKRDSWDGKRPIVPWMLGILSLHVKKAKDRAGRLIDEGRLPERAAEDPATLVADRESREVIAKKIASLPEPYAGPLQRYLLDDQPAREIARALGITANAASVRLHRGLKLLQRALPAGVSLGAAGALIGRVDAQGLAVVRREVLRGAGEVQTLTSTGSAGSAGLLTLLASKPLVTLGGAALLAGAFVLSPLELSWSGMGRTPLENPARPAAPRNESSVALAAPARASDEEQLVPALRTVAAETAPEEETHEPVDPEAWLARFTSVKHWRDMWGVSEELSQLPPDDALLVMQAIFHRIPGDGTARKQILKPFVFSPMHEHALEIIHLALTDDDLEVQNAGLVYLHDLVYRDFSEDIGGYTAWHARVAGQPLTDVVAAAARELVQRVSTLQGEELRAELERFRYLRFDKKRALEVDLAAEMRAEGVLVLIEGWLLGSDPEVARYGLGWAAELGASEDWLRAKVVPLLRDPAYANGELTSAAARALGQPGNSWAIPLLVDAFCRLPARQRELAYSTMGAVAEINDPSAIPTLIGILQADPDTHYSVGYFGLGKLTGVDYDESHGAAFWLDWWQKNQDRLPASVRGAPIPEITLAP